MRQCTKEKDRETVWPTEENDEIGDLWVSLAFNLYIIIYLGKSLFQ